MCPGKEDYITSIRASGPLPKTELSMATTKKPRTGRRENTLVKKAHELGTIPGLDVALFIRNQGRYTVYMSTDEGCWPPSMAQIVSEGSVIFFI